MMLQDSDLRWARAVVPGVLVFAIGIGLFFAWGTYNARFGVFSGAFSGIVFGWAMRRFR